MNLFDVLQAFPAFYYAVVILLGLVVGSFLNVVIHRLPLMLQAQWRNDCVHFLREHGTAPSEPDTSTHESSPPFNLATPRSRCPQCGHQITALENIPLLSYLFLKGKCAECDAPIALRYPLVETLSAVLVFGVAWHYGVSWAAGMAMLFSWALICLCFIDFDHQYLPDNITLPLLWAGLLLNLFGLYTDIESAIIGAMAGYLSLWSVYMLFKQLTGKEGMGFGDFKLLAMLGAWLGWQALPAIIILSSILGAIVGISLILLRRHGRDKPIPFGPYLAGAGWIMLIWGDSINQAYLRWVGLAPTG